MRTTLLVRQRKTGRYRKRPAVTAQAILKNWDLYLIAAVPVLYFIIFRYIPIYGAQIAFRDFNARLGIWKSPWVGFANFERFFGSPVFSMLLLNTLGLSVYRLLVSFPIPIILAISLNYCMSPGYKKTVQMVTYAPHFISMVVICGILVQLLSPRVGVVNRAIMAMGGEAIDFLAKGELFKSIYVWSDVWQSMGISSIIYIAVLSAVDPQLHESAIVDGANKLRRIWHIDLPSIMPTTVILLILNLGRILEVGFEKILLLQNPLNYAKSEIIQTYVYKVGLRTGVPQFSYATAVGLFQAVTSFLLLLVVNRIARSLNETSLW